MTQFNKTTNTRKTQNHEGADAYKQSPELELYLLVVTTNFSNKFYESGNERLSRLRTLIAMCNPVFVAKLAVYAREEMYLRTVPLVIAVELAKIHNGDDLVARLVTRVVQRADEITELLSYYTLANERGETKKLGKLSKQIQKGLSGAFNKFNEYQFGKYNRKGAVTLKDALFIVHPTAKDAEQQKLFDKIVNDSLETPYTWETQLSEKGNTKEVWTELIESKKLPYMAALRNLRNMLQAKVDFAHMNTLMNFLSDEEQVHKSKQFPFRYLSAYQQLDEVTPDTMLVLNGLEKAVKATAQNITLIGPDTTVAIACDVSASMESPISPRSTVQQYDIGLVLGMLLQNRCTRVVTSLFGDDNKFIPLPNDNILKNVQELHEREGEVGYSTNGYKVLDSLLEDNIKADKVMIFTDCQMWDSMWNDSNAMKESWKAYKKVNPDAKLYLFDLAGYGTSPLSVEDNDSVFLIGGWSDKIFGIMEAYDKKSTAVKEIQKIVL